MRVILRIAAIVGGIALVASTANAVPVEVNYSSIIARTFDDFESEPVGAFPSPGIFDGFSFSAIDPIISDVETICRSAGKCLSAGDLLTDRERIFSDFRPGTKAFGVRLGWVNPDQLSALQVIVEGSHFTRSFSNFASSGLSTTLAFADIAGLRSVTFLTSDLPGPFVTNYSFDDVLTSARPVSPVPLPATAWLMLAGLGSIFVIRSRRAKKT